MLDERRPATAKAQLPLGGQNDLLKRQQAKGWRSELNPIGFELRLFYQLPQPGNVRDDKNLYPSDTIPSDAALFHFR